MNDCDSKRWYPVASAADLPFRHILHTALADQELAVWRNDHGLINAWENRCPHRGLRLTLGINQGDSLRCQYHGWTYESGSGRCTFVPAHRDAAPPDATRVYAFAAREAHGLVWVSLGGPEQEPPALDDAGVQGPPIGLRSLPFDCGIAQAMQALQADGSRFAECLHTTHDGVQARPLADNALEFARVGGPAIRLFLQPHSPGKTIVHAQISGVASVGLYFHKLFADILNEVRRNLEGRFANPNHAAVRNSCTTMSRRA